VPLSRRALLAAGLTATLAGCAHRSPAKPVWAQPVASGSPVPPVASRLPVPPVVSRTPVPPTAVPYARPVTDVLTRYLRPTQDNPRHPGYAGAVALVAVDGRTTLHTAVGDAVRYQAGPVELPAGRRVRMRPDAIFDLASLTKVYTAILVLQLVDRGKVDLYAPVRRYLPEFSGDGKEPITVAMLLAHTGALPVGAKVTGRSGTTARWAAVMSTPLVRGGRPGTTFRYSSLGLMVLGRLVEKITGKPLDRALRDTVTGPLGLTDTGYTPLRWAAKDRLVATDARSSRGLLRGTVHDDVCNHLGGVAGHAGLFGTAAEVAVIGQLLLNGGTYDGRRILSSAVVRRALTNVNRGKPAIDAERPGRSADHGLGVEMNQPWFMGKLASPTSFGHTGFTGTSLLVVPDRSMVVVLLTNRAHPNWSWSNPDTHRVAVANAIAGTL
jgi:CubicO group peptidase (beta-lactamase class C family)